MVSIAAVNEAGEGEIEKVYVYTLETGEKYISEILGYVEKIFYNIFRFWYLQRLPWSPIYLRSTRHPLQ